MIRTLRRSIGAVSLLALLTTLASAPAAGAATVFSDGFESGSFSTWSSVPVTGGASATVQSQLARGGSYAARLAAPSGGTSYARKSFSVAQKELTVAGDLRILADGPSGNVPLLRLYDAAGNRLVSLFRQNASYDRLGVQHSGRYDTTSGTLPLNTWARFELTIKAAGAASTITVKRDATVIFQTTSANLGSIGARTLQIGNEEYYQPFDLVADNIVATSPATASPPTSPPPTSSVCAPGAAPPTTSDPGTVVVADNFENGLGNWSVAQQGDARVSTQSQTVRADGCAGRISVSASYTSLGNMTKALPAGSREVWASGWFNFETQGQSSSWNLPTFRFFSAGKRVLDVSRQNGSGGLFVRYPNGSGGWTILPTGLYPSLGRWYHLRIHAIANWSSSTVEVWLDGSPVFATTRATLGTGALNVQMVGADHAGQQGVVAVDDIVVKARS